MIDQDFRKLLSALEEIARQVWSNGGLESNVLVFDSSDAKRTFVEYFSDKYREANRPELKETDFIGTINAVNKVVSAVLDTDAITISTEIVNGLCEHKSESKFFVAKFEDLDCKCVQIIFKRKRGINLLDLYFQYD